MLGTYFITFIYKYAINNNNKSTNSVFSYLLVCFIHRYYIEKGLCYVFLTLYMFCYTKTTGCLFYGIPEHGSCHRISHGMHASYAIKVLCSRTW